MSEWCDSQIFLFLCFCTLKTKNLSVLNIYCFIIKKSKHYFNTILKVSDKKKKSCSADILILLLLTCLFTLSKNLDFLSLIVLLAKSLSLWAQSVMLVVYFFIRAPRSSRGGERCQAVIFSVPSGCLKCSLPPTIQNCQCCCWLAMHMHYGWTWFSFFR